MSFSSSEIVATIKKNVISVVCIVLALVLAAVLYFRLDRGTELETELGDKSKEAAKFALNVKNSAQLQPQLDALLASEKQIEARLMRAEDLPTNQQYFYKLETDTGVKLLTTPRQSPGSKKDSKAYQPTAFSLNVQGD